jgi:hypothetical protein
MGTIFYISLEPLNSISDYSKCYLGVLLVNYLLLIVEISWRELMFWMEVTCRDFLEERDFEFGV